MKKEVKYNSNLQKTGAAIQDTKVLLKHWRNDIPQKELVQSLISDNVLGKKSRKRTYDVLRRTFIPRYIDGYPKGHWIYLKKLTEADVSSSIIDQILYFHAAINEPLIGDFVAKFLLPNYKKGILEVTSDNVKNFIKDGIKNKTIPVSWSDAVTYRVASGIYAALTEFKIIEGKRKRKISSSIIPIQVFYYIAFFISKEVSSSKEIINHNYWKLFLLNNTEIEHLFMEAHQDKYLTYEQLGSVRRINFFEKTFEEAVNVIINRAS